MLASFRLCAFTRNFPTNACPLCLAKASNQRVSSRKIRATQLQTSHGTRKYLDGLLHGPLRPVRLEVPPPESSPARPGIERLRGPRRGQQGAGLARPRRGRLRLGVGTGGAAHVHGRHRSDRPRPRRGVRVRALRRGGDGGRARLLGAPRGAAAVLLLLPLGFLGRKRRRRGGDGHRSCVLPGGPHDAASLAISLYLSSKDARRGNPRSGRGALRSPRRHRRGKKRGVGARGEEGGDWKDGIEERGGPGGG